MESFNRRLVHRLRSVSFYASFVIVISAIAVITGWIFDSTLLTSIHPDYVPMEFNTALSFLLLGISLLAFHQGKLSRTKIISVIPAIIVLALSILTLGQYLFNTDAFINEQARAQEIAFPGRMATVTTFSLFIAATSLLLLNTGKWSVVYLAQALSAGLVLFNLIPLMGYVADRPQLYGFNGYSGMALHTTLLMLLAGSGILFAFPRSGIIALVTEGSVTGYILRKFMPVSLLLPVIIIMILLLFELTGMVSLQGDILLVSLLMITGFILFLLWFLRSLQILELSRSRAMDKAYITSEQIRHHIENSPLAVIEWDNDFRVKKWSWQARELFGWKSAEVFNKRHDEWKFVHESNSEQVKSTMQRLGTGKESSTILAGRNYTKSGKTVHCVWYNSVLYDRNGKIISVLSLIDNVTGQKNTERELAEREEQYRSLIEILQDAILIYQDNRMVFLNPAALKLYGARKPEQIMEKPAIELFHKDYHEIIRERADDLIKGKPVPVIEEKIVRFDGRAVDVEVAATSFMYKKKTAIMIVLRDITERKIALKKLKRNEFLLRMAGNLAQVGGWMVNLAERKIVWSAQVAAIHEMPSDYSPTVKEAIGFYAPEYADRIQQVFNYCANKGIPYDEEMQLITGKGRRVWVRTIGVAERDESGRIVNVIGGFQDITARKNNEEEIRSLNEELEQRVRERTMQLEASNRELEAFSYSISHDLRAPLRAINGYTRILIEDHSAGFDKNGIRVCYTVMENARKMAQLIDELLAFSKIGKRDLRFSLIDMNQLPGEVFEEVTTTDERGRIKLNTGRLCSVYGDPAMIRQVWTNLISNAVKFTSMEKNPHIAISCTDAGDYCEFSVKDNGAGFDMKYADRIFGVFKRLHSAKQFEGTGVGLAIVQRIIQKHGGTVRAEGKPGEGATFYFSLPVKKPSDNFRNPDKRDSLSSDGGNGVARL